nr:group II intron maturase-specific domain-containing protein [Bacillus sp. Marseille-P3661]
MKIKEKTRKTLTLNKEEWINRVNPIIRGKMNYYLTIIKAIKANEEYGQESHCRTRMMRGILQRIDGYIRKGYEWHLFISILIKLKE